MTLGLGFFLTWAVLIAGCIATFVWGCIRNWELQIVIPVYVAIKGTFVIGIVYLVVDFLARHISIH